MVVVERFTLWGLRRREVCFSAIDTRWLLAYEDLDGWGAGVGVSDSIVGAQIMRCML